MGRLGDIQIAIVTAVTVFITNMRGNKKDFSFIENSFGRDSKNNQLVENEFMFQVLELFECRRGDPYMTANRNFVSFAHS